MIDDPEGKRFSSLRFRIRGGLLASRVDPFAQQRDSSRFERLSRDGGRG